MCVCDDGRSSLFLNVRNQLIYNKINSEKRTSRVITPHTFDQIDTMSTSFNLIGDFKKVMSVTKSLLMKLHIGQNSNVWYEFFGKCVQLSEHQKFLLNYLAFTY